MSANASVVVSPKPLLLCLYNKGTPKHDEGLVLDALQMHKENAQTFLSLNTHSPELQH